MKAVNLTQNTVVASQVIIADTFFSRMKGLLGREKLGAGEGLVITHCRSIHMLFMKFSIDAVFLDKNDQVVGLVERIRPYGFSPVFLKAVAVLEVNAGTIAASKTGLGDRFKIE